MSSPAPVRLIEIAIEKLRYPVITVGCMVCLPLLAVFFVILDDLVFYRNGKQIAVNLYDLDSLNGFGRAALNGLLLVVGALALTTLQTIDREFSLIDDT